LYKTSILGHQSEEEPGSDGDQPVSNKIEAYMIIGSPLWSAFFNYQHA